jgi:hypothetical protein
MIFRSLGRGSPGFDIDGESRGAEGGRGFLIPKKAFHIRSLKRLFISLLRGTWQHFFARQCIYS